jgi:hypothetical protein
LAVLMLMEVIIVIRLDVAVVLKVFRCVLVGGVFCIGVFHRPSGKRFAVQGIKPEPK